VIRGSNLPRHRDETRILAAIHVFEPGRDNDELTSPDLCTSGKKARRSASVHEQTAPPPARGADLLGVVGEDDTAARYLKYLEGPAMECWSV
jgi:hypothetical protein